MHAHCLCDVLAGDSRIDQILVPDELEGVSISDREDLSLIAQIAPECSD